MADFFKGLQGGFQTGLQLGQAIRQRRQEEDLAKAYGLTPEEQQAALATPEQLAGARAETQALQQQDIADFGLTPEEAQRYAPTMPQEGQRVGLSTYRLGDQTFQQAPTQSQLDAARMRAAADVYGRYGDAAKREELMRGLRAEERATAAETRAQKNFETQQQEAQFRLRELGRSEDATTRYNAFSEFAAKNPNMSTEELRNTARTQFGFTPEQELKYINTRLGLQEGETKEFAARIAKKLKGKSLTQLGELYNADSDFDDNTDLSIIPGKNGAVTLNFIDKKTGKTTSSNSFGSEALAVEYLGKQATDPLNTGTWLLGVKAKEQTIAASEASAAKDRALTGAYGQGLKSSNLIDVKRPDGSVTQVDRSKYMVDGELQLPKGYSLIKAEQTAAQLPAALKTRYDELVKSDRWERARTADERILLLEKEGIPPALVGLRSPTDDLIALMKSGGAKNAPAATPVATPAGQQLVNLAGQMLPPAPTAPVAPTTSAQRLRGLYLGNQ